MLSADEILKARSDSLEGHSTKLHTAYQEMRNFLAEKKCPKCGKKGEGSECKECKIEMKGFLSDEIGFFKKLGDFQEVAVAGISTAEQTGLTFGINRETGVIQPIQSINPQQPQFPLSAPTQSNLIPQALVKLKELPIWSVVLAIVVIGIMAILTFMSYSDAQNQINWYQAILSDQSLVSSYQYEIAKLSLPLYVAKQQQAIGLFFAVIIIAILVMTAPKILEILSSIAKKKEEKKIQTVSEWVKDEFIAIRREYYSIFRLVQHQDQDTKDLPEYITSVVPRDLFNRELFSEPELRQQLGNRLGTIFQYSETVINERITANQNAVARITTMMGMQTGPFPGS